VQDLAALAVGHRGQVLLLAPDPLHAVAGVHRDHAHGHDLAPRAAAGGGRLTVHERGHREAVERRQARDQLTGVRLHSAGLPGHEEDEVEPDAHHRAEAASARS
jgi:hypothetical protein